MNRGTRRTAVVAGLLLAVAGSAVSPAAVAGPTAAQGGGGRPNPVDVRGRQIPVDAAAGTYVMEGDLVGDWLYVPRTPPLHSSDTLYVEAGTEIFRGCIDQNRNGRCGAGDINGELRLAFIYWASFDLDGNLIKGQCVHPVTGGRGGFVGARGRLDMVDRPVGDQVKTTYRGTIILNAVPTEGPAPAVQSAARSVTARQASAPLRRGC